MIPFTQFLRPDGRQKLVHIQRPDAIEERAQRIIAAGYRFEIEQLDVPEPLPDISMTISDDRGDHAVELCRNGPEVPVAVDRLILSFKAVS